MSDIEPGRSLAPAAIQSRPRLFAARNPLVHLGLKRRRAERMPFLEDSVEQQPLSAHGKLLEPGERLGAGLVSDRYRDVDGQPAPREIRRQQDQVGLVGPHPFRQRTVSSEPSADELPARILRPRRIDAAAVAAAEWARLSAIDLMTMDFDFQPTVATGGAAAALPFAVATRCGCVVHDRPRTNPESPELGGETAPLRAL
jgi:hypothetical protein